VFGINVSAQTVVGRPETTTQLQQSVGNDLNQHSSGKPGVKSTLEDGTDQNVDEKCEESSKFDSTLNNRSLSDNKVSPMDGQDDKVDHSTGTHFPVKVLPPTDSSEESDLESSADEGEYELHIQKCPVTGKPKKRVSFAEPIESSVEVENSDSEFTTASEDSSLDSDEDTISSSEESETDDSEDDRCDINQITAKCSAIGDDLLKEILKTFGESGLKFEPNKEENFEDAIDYSSVYPKAFRDDRIQSAELVEQSTEPKESIAVAIRPGGAGEEPMVQVDSKSLTSEPSSADVISHKLNDFPGEFIQQEGQTDENTPAHTGTDKVKKTKDKKPSSDSHTTKGKAKNKKPVSDDSPAERKKKANKKHQEAVPTEMQIQVIPPVNIEEKISAAPQFTIAPMPLVNVKQGHSIKLACRVQGQRSSSRLECHV
jgi:hypothetical protein